MKICKCSQKIYGISQLKNIKAVGFALFGECPRCGTKMPCGEMWKRTKRATYSKNRVLAL